MDWPIVVAVLVIGVAAGALIGWLAGSRGGVQAKATVTSLRQQLDGVVAERDSARIQVAEHAAEASNLKADLEGLRAGSEERQAALQAQIDRMSTLTDEIVNRFSVESGKTFESAQKKFLNEAKEVFGAAKETTEKSVNQILNPMKETLEEYRKDLRQLEQARKGAFDSITTQMQMVREGQENVAKEALKLRSALRSGTTVGRWGEEQCRNVLEGAGLVEGVDFDEQAATDDVEDRSRPDFVVKIPGGRKLIIDVKCSLDAFIKATETDDPIEQDRLLVEHAKAIKSHATGLSKREYQQKFKSSSNFVVMFVPGENFLHAAIQKDKELLRIARKGNVSVVGPTNLVSMAMTIAMLRDQARLQERAEQIRDVGLKLYKNLAVLGRNTNSFSSSLRTLLNKWSTLVGTIDGNLLSSARKFDELGVGLASSDVQPADVVEAEVKDSIRLLAGAPQATETDAGDGSEH